MPTSPNFLAAFHELEIKNSGCNLSQGKQNFAGTGIPVDLRPAI